MMATKSETSDEELGDVLAPEKQIKLLHRKMVQKLSENISPEITDYWRKFINIIKSYIDDTSLVKCKSMFDICDKLSEQRDIKVGKYNVLLQTFKTIRHNVCSEIVTKYSSQIRKLQQTTQREADDPEELKLYASVVSRWKDEEVNSGEWVKKTEKLNVKSENQPQPITEDKLEGKKTVKEHCTEKNIPPQSQESSHKAIHHRSALICTTVLSFLFISASLLNRHQPDVSKKAQTKCTEAVDKMRRLDKYCYETKAVTAVKKNIERYKYLTVTGVPGSGKTTAIQHAALYLHDRYGYEICIIEDFEEFLSNIILTKKQVFVLNDPFGVYDIDWSSVRIWELVKVNITTLLKQTKNIKVLFSLRLSVLYNPRIRQMAFFNHKESCLIDFSHSKYQLSPMEMRNMLKKHLSERGEKANVNDIIRIPSLDSEEYKLAASIFPLMCTLYIERSKKNISNEGSMYYVALRTHFKEIKNNNRRQFCGLVLIALFGGKIDDDYFNHLAEPYGRISSNNARLRDAVLDEFQLTKGDLQNIFRELVVLNGTYLMYDEKIGIIEFSHSVFRDVIAFVHKNNILVLQISSFDFVMNRVRIDHWTSIYDPHMVVFDKSKDIQELSKKLWKDLLDDPIRAGKLINYPHIDNDILITSMDKYSEQRKDVAENLTFINTIFKISLLTIAERRVSCYDDADCKGNIFILGHKFIKILLQRGANSNIRLDNHGNLPVHVAAMIKNKALAEILIENNAHVRGKNIFNRSVFHGLLKYNYPPEQVEHYCLSEVGIRRYRTINVTSVILSMATLFFDLGSSINTPDIYGITPLHLTMRFEHGNVLPIVKMLISRGADVNAKDNRGMTPLHYLASSRIHNAPQILELLINSNCNVLAVDDDKNSVLHRLILPIHYLNINNEEQYPLSENRLGEEEIISNKLKLAEMFITLGVNVNTTNKFGETALHTIATGPSCCYLRSVVNDSINSPLIKYSTKHEIQILQKIIKLYLKEGGNVNALDNDGNHVLHSLQCLPPWYIKDMLLFL